MLGFEWDKEKEEANVAKHTVSFTEAQTVFYDSNARYLEDPDHSDEEPRFLLLGFSIKFRILVVSATLRDEDEVIRIISARKATKQEKAQYEGFKQ